MAIFQDSILKSTQQDENLIAARWLKFQNFLSKVEFIKSVKEEKYQDGFLHDIFEECLGYTLDNTNPQNFNLEREKKNETDSKKADGVIYVNGEILGIIELKDQKSKNLDAIETQAFNYHNSHSNSKYIIISNFDELRFYIDKKTAYEKFNLFYLTYEEFKKLHLLLSYESIKEGLPLKLKEKSANFEQQISKELYRDFSIFRNHLFENIVKNNFSRHSVLDAESSNNEAKASLPMEKSTLLRLTQKLCDRIIFILFAEDRGLLRHNTIKEIREEFKAQKFTSYTLYDIYKFYFNAINEGAEKLGIPKYNGGLFANDELLDSLIIEDIHLDMEAQKLSDYDFASEISVNILGHIFEQSLTDLEEIQANIDNADFDKKQGKRKKDGVFYTPEYITRYIVENTLGRLCEEKREQLQIGGEILIPSNSKKLTKAEQVHKQNILDYREWLTNLKILDPACGSGAFLNQALEFLIKEHTLVRDMLLPFEDLTLGYEIEKEILEHNLYGVDINEDAVEIAKLSLWLRTAHRGRELTSLANKIKCGNSLIDDKTVAKNAFAWEEEFAEVFAKGGFDVVIGNPPYGASLSNEEKNFFYTKYKTVEYQLDTYTLFMEKAHSILKQNGKLGFIVPSTWLTMFYFKNLRKYLIDNSYFESALLFRYQVFEDVTAETSIITLSKNQSQNEKISINYFDNANEVETKYYKNISQNEWQNSYELGFNILFEGNKLGVINKIVKDSIELEKLVDIPNGIKPYEVGKGNPKQTRDDVKNRVYDASSQLDETYHNYIVGGSIQKFFITPAKTDWIKFGDNLAAPRKNFNFFQKKIMVRQTSDCIIASIDYQGLLSLNNVHNIVITNENLKYETLVCILNSKLMDFYYKFLVPEEGRTFAEVKAVNLKRLPLKQIDENFNQEPFIEKADKMLLLNKQLQETKQNFTNELGLEKLTKKLQNFEELEFEEFVSEYAKAKKLKFADKLHERNFKQEWQAIFENDKILTCRLKDEIAKTDKEIDAMVYKLYDLSEDEIRIVEGELI